MKSIPLPHRSKCRPAAIGSTFEICRIKMNRIFSYLTNNPTIGVIASICTLITTIFATVQILGGIPKTTTDFIEGLGAVQLTATYPDEKWYDAEPAQYKWLAGEWCYQGALTGHKVAYSVENGGISIQYPEGPELYPYRPYQSNQGVLRLEAYEAGAPSIFMKHSPKKPFENQEYSRDVSDNGTITNGSTFLSLKCDSCRVFLKDGLPVYECN